MSIVSRLVQSFARRTETSVGRAASREVAQGASRQAARTLGRDVVQTSGRRVAAAVDTPTFEAALAAAKAVLKKEGRYANVSSHLTKALEQATTTQEALQVATLARQLAVGYNTAHRGVLTEALTQGAAKAQVTDEAFAVVKQVVKTRQEAYALFNVTERRKLVESAVERYLTVGEAELPAEELARKVVHLVQPRLDQASKRATIRRVSLLETLVERVQALTNFIHKAVS